MANFVSNDNATSLMNAINQKKDSKPSTITWAEWIALTDEQREGTHYIITNVPAKFSDKDAVFSIKDQTLTFTNKTATVSDTRITSDTYIFTFYHNQAVAQAAGIECSWTTGTVTFTVVDTPASDIVVDILCILPALATPPSEGGSSIFYGTCTGQAANQIKAVTVSNEQGFKLKAGSVLSVKFDANNTYSATAEDPIKLNVNNTGAKQIYGGNTATPTGTNTTYFGRLNYYNYYVYDGTYWVWAGSSADNNTTYTPQGLGFGYAICSTAAATTAKVATLSGYSLVTNGIVSVKFTNSVPANATLNINNKGAKNIYYQGAKIVAGVIKAGDIATFVYSGNYNLICIDRGSNGHIIVDSSGSQLASENSLQFADSHVSDNPTNGRTIVENIKEHTTASDYENATEDGIHVIDDGNDVPIGASSEDYVEVVADGVKNLSVLLDELYALIDTTKLSGRSNLYFNNAIFNYHFIERNNHLCFSLTIIDGSVVNIQTYILRASGSGAYVYDGTNISQYGTTNIPTSGTKITLYYGTSSTVINLKTSANYCMMSDGETSVESEIGRNCHKALTFTASTTYNNVKDLIDFSRNPYLKFDYNGRTILCHLYRQGTGTFDFMSLGALVSESYLVRFGSTGLTVYAYNDSGSTTTTITSSITDAVLYY